MKKYLNILFSSLFGCAMLSSCHDFPEAELIILNLDNWCVIFNLNGSIASRALSMAAL